MDERFKTVDDYIKSFPADVQAVLYKLRQTVRETAPAAQESVSYNMPAYKLGGKVLVYFAGYPRHIGFYALPSGTAAFQRDISAYKHGKGSIRFPLDKPIPYDLVKRIVAFRVKELGGQTPLA